MPFTISHAAAVLPLRKISKGAFPLAALMIGSMSPDFAYFLPFNTDRVETHSIPGLFWFCWPISLAVWLVFVHVLERPTIALLPESWQTKFAASGRVLTLKSLALASVAIVAGAVTHLIWDGFTHRGTTIVGILPWLHEPAFYHGRWPIRRFMVLQHLSSIAGIVLLAIWAWRLPPGQHAHESLPQISNATRIRAFLFLVSVSLGLAITGYLIFSDTWFSRRLFFFAIGGMLGWAIAWFAVALVLGRRPARPAPDR